MTYTFVKDGEISPENPIANDKSFLRNSLEIGIKDSLEKNHKNADFLGTNIIKIFEIGNVFSKNGEKMMLGIGIKNKSGIKKPKPVDGLKEVVAILSDIFKKDISIDLHPEQEFFEIDLGEIYKDLDCDSSYIKIENDMDIKFKPISSYPYITRDIAIWIPEADENQDIPKILDIIKKHSGDFLVKEPRLFDAFSKEGRKSVAYRLVFQSYQKTLTDQEINSIMEEIYSEIKHFDKWEIR
jgi:phenylalanyl-tRNA synthetase beta subunit